MGKYTYNRLFFEKNLVDPWAYPPRPLRDCVLGWFKYETGYGYWAITQYVKDDKLGDYYMTGGRINNNIKGYIPLPPGDWKLHQPPAT